MIARAFFLLTLAANAQVFIPVSFWRPKNTIQVQCFSGCYPTSAIPFSAALYYIPVSTPATFSASAVFYNLCWGPTTGGGCSATPLYPLACTGAGLGAIDGSSAFDQADYTAPATVTTDTCNVTAYTEPTTKSFNIQSFNPVVVSPVTSAMAPRNICVTKTQTFTATGGLGTLNWVQTVGAGSITPTTGGSSTYTASGAATSVEITTTDSTTSMSVTSYVNVISTITISPLATIETPVNNPTFLQDPTTNAGMTYVANLVLNANCGIQNYSVSCVGGGSVSPTTVADNGTVRYTPASTTGTSTITFTDSAGTPQSATRTVYNIVPVDVAGSWGYHSCIKYSHSTYGAGLYKLKCFGFNSSGQLGYGNTVVKGRTATDLGVGNTFLKNTGTAGADMLVKDMSVGLQHTCVILSNNTVKCWGSNTYGQLGYDNTTALSSPSASVVNIGAGTPKKLYAAGFVTCLTFSDDRIKCWGRNAQGQLGQDNTINYGSNSGTGSMAGLGYISVGGSFLTVQRVAPSENAVCVLSAASFAPGASKVYCWGYGNGGGCNFSAMPDTNYCGELGRGTANANWGDGTNLMSALTPVNLGVTGSELVIDIAAGRKHICAIIAPTLISTAGTPICWGFNGRGQLGIDNLTDIGATSTPTTRVTSISNAARFEMAAETSCAILSDSSAKCWGRGTYGVLLGGNSIPGGGYNRNIGDGSPLMSGLAALNIGAGLTFKKMAVNYASACAILNNDFMKCWGAQFCGIGGSNTNNGCVFSGVSTALVNNAGTPMMTSRYIGDSSAAEVGDNLPFLNH